MSGSTPHGESGEALRQQLAEALARVNELEALLEDLAGPADHLPADEMNQIAVRLARQIARVRERRTLHSEALTRLATSRDALRGDFAPFARRVLETAARTLGIERASLWLFNPDRSKLVCEDLFEASRDRHSAGVELDSESYPRYFAALQDTRGIAAEDAHHDPRTSEFRESYLSPLGIGALLDTPVRRGGELFGVVCHEHVGPPRRWAADERDFGASVADLIALGLEVSERRRAELLREGRSRVLELVATGAPLDQVLDALVRSAEAQCPGTICSLMLVDRQAGVLRLGAAPNMPPELRRAIDPFPIGPTSGACGSAAHHGQRVVVEDLMQDPRTAEWRGLAGKLSLRSCWSQPVIGGEGQVLGTFAIYDSRPRRPDAGDVRLIEDAARLGGIAIERDRAETERRQLEEQLRLSQKMEAVGQLAGGVAHDFNNLLTAVMGNAEMLLETVRGAPPSDFRDMALTSLAEIHRAGQRAATLTRQLLAFGRKQLREREVLDPNRVVEQLRTMLGPLLGERIELRMELAPDVASIYFDPGQIEQVMLNLILNAHDAMPDGGKLTIATSNVDLDDAYVRSHMDARPGPHVLISVQDTGVGMTRETRTRVFEPFFTTKPVGRGTGLGLATVFGIVSQAGGHIAVDSSIGRGSTFRVFIPAVADRARPGATLEPGPAPRGEETVLVCEDDDMVLQLTRQVLHSAGYTVLAAESGEMALEIAARQREPIQLLLTDTVLPGINGRKLAAELLALRPEIRVLYVSGYTPDVIASQGIAEDDPLLLQKPFSPTALLQRVREVLDEGKR